MDRRVNNTNSTGYHGASTLAPKITNGQIVPGNLYYQADARDFNENDDLCGNNIQCKSPYNCNNVDMHYLNSKQLKTNPTNYNNQGSTLIPPQQNANSCNHSCQPKNINCIKSQNQNMCQKGQASQNQDACQSNKKLQLPMSSQVRRNSPAAEYQSKFIAQPLPKNCSSFQPIPTPIPEPIFNNCPIPQYRPPPKTGCDSQPPPAPPIQEPNFINCPIPQYQPTVEACHIYRKAPTPQLQAPYTFRNLPAPCCRCPNKAPQTCVSPSPPPECQPPTQAPQMYARPPAPQCKPLTQSPQMSMRPPAPQCQPPAQAPQMRMMPPVSQCQPATQPPQMSMRPPAPHYNPPVQRPQVCTRPPAPQCQPPCSRGHAPFQQAQMQRCTPASQYYTQTQQPQMINNFSSPQCQPPMPQVCENVPATQAFSPNIAPQMNQTQYDPYNNPVTEKKAPPKEEDVAVIDEEIAILPSNKRKYSYVDLNKDGEKGQPQSYKTLVMTTPNKVEPNRSQRKSPERRPQRPLTYQERLNLAENGEIPDRDLQRNQTRRQSPRNQGDTRRSPPRRPPSNARGRSQRERKPRSGKSSDRKERRPPRKEQSQKRDRSKSKKRSASERKRQKSVDRRKPKNRSASERKRSKALNREELKNRRASERKRKSADRRAPKNRSASARNRRKSSNREKSQKRRSPVRKAPERRNSANRKRSRGKSMKTNEYRMQVPDEKFLDAIEPNTSKKYDLHQARRRNRSSRRYSDYSNLNIYPYESEPNLAFHHSEVRTLGERPITLSNSSFDDEPEHIQSMLVHGRPPMKNTRRAVSRINLNSYQGYR